MEQDIKGIYRDLGKKYSDSLNFTKVKLRRLSVLRLLSFLLAIISPALLYQYSSGTAIFSSVLFLVIFLFLVKKYGKTDKERQLLENYTSLNRNEIKALDFDFSSFSPGSRYIDTDHEYTYDLDIFGDYSLFRFLNRTSTRTGDEQLAFWLTHPIIEGTEITERQNAVKELVPILEWRQKLSAYGLLYRENKDDVDTLKNWGEAEINFPGISIYRLLGKIVPAVTIIILGICIAGIISFNFIAVPVAFQVLLLFGRRKEVVFFFRTFGKRSAILSKYSELFHIIENEPFHSELLKKWQDTLTSGHATKNIRQLNREVNLFDARLNVFAGIILNAIFLWDINRCVALADWHKKNSKNLTVWLRVLSKFDAIISLANFSFNYPSNVFPKYTEDKTGFRVYESGHPMIPVKERVNNTFSLSGEGNFAIVTGANMAGKSTFLRTIGVNLVLAMSGAPVCAEEFEFTPMALYTHMRTDDNLSRHESYFFAELKRLKAILEKLEDNGKVFIILDEILRGTNSEDKLKGSTKYLEQLIEKNGTGIVATHDLKLTELKERYPDKIENVCFEIELSDEGLKFDYKLSEGVTKTMNATFLMKQMGII